MKYVKLESLDINNTFFHFTRIANRRSIEKIGLQAVACGENGIANDKDNRAIYFAVGVEGALKTLDAWVRIEYDRIANNSGYLGIDEDIMNQTYKKLYNDFKNRQYYKLDLIEGNNPKNSDFSYENQDPKKIYVSKIGNPKLRNAMEWEYGPYSNFNSMQQEIWNMNTHIGKKSIKANRLSIIENSEGRSDALSIAIELYRKYRNTYINIDLSFLDNFMEYAIEAYRKDADFLKGMPDYGRREPLAEDEEAYKRINKIRTQPPKKCRTGLMNSATCHIKRVVQSREEVLKVKQ